MKSFFILILILPLKASAGFFEFGLTGSYRKSYIPSSNNTISASYDEARALNTSITYYFTEMTAIELSYTQGEATRFIDFDTTTSSTQHNYSLIGTDFVWTFAQRSDPFIPYVKIGGAYFIQKKVEISYYDKNSMTELPTPPIELQNTLVPSAGFGLKTRLTDRISFKVGIDAWTSGPVSQNSGKFDWAGKAGISWFL